MGKRIGHTLALLGALGLSGGSAAAGNSSLAPLIQEEQPIMTAAATSSTAMDVGGSALANAQTMKYEKIFSGCSYAVSANWSPVATKMYNDIDPVSGVIMYLAEHGLFVKGITASSGIDPNQFKITVLQYPAHGEFLSDSYTYHANQGYLGADRVTFEVEVLNRKFKVIWTLVVQDSNPDGPTPNAVKTFDKVCPPNKGSSLDIIGEIRAWPLWPSTLPKEKSPC